MTQTCHMQLLQETTQCCIHISWTQACLLCRTLSHCFSYSLFFFSLLFIESADMQPCTLKGLLQASARKIVLIPLTKVFLNSGTPPATMYNAGFIFGTLVPQHLGVLLGKAHLEMQQCPHLAHRFTTPTTRCHSSEHMQ